MSDKQSDNTQARLNRFESLMGPSSETNSKGVSASPEKATSKKKEPAKSASPKQIRRQSYDTTMDHVEQTLNPLQRLQSKFMRLPFIDEISLLASKTIFRPSALLGAGLVSSLGMLLLLYIARTIGFRTSGSELFILLAVGWLTGLIIEAITAIYRRLFNPN